MNASFCQSALEAEAQRLERERRELEFERRRLEEEKTLVATQKKVISIWTRCKFARGQAGNVILILV